MKNIAIIGGGIAGLYAAYRLSKKRIPCTLFESTTRLGGRIHTYQDAYLGQIEAGAGRFLLSHKYLVRLLKELHLYDKKVAISGHSEYKPSSGSPLYQVLHNRKMGHIKDLIQTVIHAAKSRPKSKLRQMVFLDFARQVLKPEESILLYDSFGYSTELTIMNAYDAVKMIENHLLKPRFYILAGGLEQIVTRIVGVLEKSDYVTIRAGCPIENISPLAHGGYALTTSKGGVVEFAVCICAVPVPALRRWPIFRPIKPVLDTIVCSPLCRIYSVIEGVGSKLSHKFTTNTNIRYYIPMGGDVAMISYTDNDYARRWNRIYQEGGLRVLNRELKTELGKTVGGPINITPKHTKIFYWDCGVGYWGLGADSAKFDKQPLPGLFICGENVSQENQQWIEGALDTAEWVLAKVK